MKNRTTILPRLLAEMYLRIHECQTQPKPKKALMAVAFLLFCSLAAHAQVGGGPVPAPPAGKMYDFDDYNDFPVQNNLCWAYAKGYNQYLSIATVDLQPAKDRCGTMVFPFPPQTNCNPENLSTLASMLGDSVSPTVSVTPATTGGGGSNCAPVEFTSYTDCLYKQEEFFTTGGPDGLGAPAYVKLKEVYASMLAGGFTCTPTMKANPFLVTSFVKPYPPPGWPY